MAYSELTGDEIDPVDEEDGTFVLKDVSETTSVDDCTLEDFEPTETSELVSVNDTVEDNADSCIVDRFQPCELKNGTRVVDST